MRAALSLFSGASFLEGGDSTTRVLQSSYGVADQVGAVGELGHHSTRLGHTGHGQSHNGSRQTDQVGGDSAYIEGFVIQLGVGIFESVGGAKDVRSEKPASHESHGHAAEPFGHVAGTVQKLRVESIGCQTQSERGIVLSRLPAFIKEKHTAVFKKLCRGRQEVAGFTRRGVGRLLPLLLLLLPFRRCKVGGSARRTLYIHGYLHGRIATLSEFVSDIIMAYSNRKLLNPKLTGRQTTGKARFRDLCAGANKEMRIASTLSLLFLSNLFMTYAWYGHLKTHKESPLFVAVLISWGIAFFEYCLQVPANRIGSAALSLPQLKVIQEVLALLAFVVLYRYLWEGSLNWNHAAAGVCLVGAVFFVFR